MPTINYKVMIIHISDEEHLYKQILIKDLPKNWRSISAYSVLQNLGSSWYTNKESLILKIPSAIIPQEYNYIINTTHPDFSTKAKLIGTENYFWDARLLR